MQNTFLLCQASAHSLEQSGGESGNRDRYPVALADGDRSSQLRIHEIAAEDFSARFPDEEACGRYLMRHRWPDGVHCPNCRSDRVRMLRDWYWECQCPDCREDGGVFRFSHVTGTIFATAERPLRDWFRVLHLILISDKATTSRHIHRALGSRLHGPVQALWRRLRSVLANSEFRRLVGIAEAGGDRWWVQRCLH